MADWKELASKYGGEALEKLEAPQKALLKKTAETIGADSKSDSADETSMAIADKVASKLGIPEDERFGAAARAGISALTRVFGDPLGFVPAGKIAAGAKGLAAMGLVSKLGKGSKALEQATHIAKGIETVGKPLSKAGNIGKGGFIAEQAIPAGQKISQKLTSGADFAAKQKAISAGKNLTSNENVLYDVYKKNPKFAEVLDARYKPLLQAATDPVQKARIITEMRAHALEMLKKLGM